MENFIKYVLVHKGTGEITTKVARSENLLGVNIDEYIIRDYPL